MNTKIIERTLTPTICTFYLLMCCLLAATAEGKTVIDIWGGFVPSGGLLSNVIGIVRWNICVYDCGNRQIKHFYSNKRNKP